MTPAPRSVAATSQSKRLRLADSDNRGDLPEGVKPLLRILPAVVEEIAARNVLPLSERLTWRLNDIEALT